ncbi:MAG: site-specific DNA-methyltransferase [Candidatus Heimdallarchaeota archaeon]|nr:site-specific DNA-methyltransferase [Candidatus Heimdallarchaeota archaeon]
MRSVEDESIDLVVTSPPYPMIEMWDEQFKSINPEISKAMDTQNGNLVFQLMHRIMNKTWEQICRVMKPGGIVCINIGDATRKFNDKFRLFPNHMMIMNFFHSAGYSTLPLILWRKQTNKPNKFMGSGMLPPGAYVTLEHEYILIFRKGNKRQFNDKEKQNRRKSSYFWHERNKWFSDVWLDLKGDRQILKKNGSRDRSGSYPFELVYRLINMFSVRGDEKDQILVASPKAVACIFPIVCDFFAAGNTRKINLWSSPATCKTSG